METNNINNPDSGNRFQHNNSGRVLAGIILLIIGAAFFAREAGVFLPRWLFHWPMILVAVGLFIGARRSFQFGGWIFPLAIGGIFLVDDIFDDFDFDLYHYLWPSLFIFLGLYMIFKPRRKDWKNDWQTTATTDDVIDATAVFGGTKSNIISKNFKGGEISTFFGGTDLDLMQADFQGTIVIQTATAFGGVKLIAPAHWNIKSEVVCILGGIDDKRPQAKEATDMTKTLVLKGTCIFGGIEIKSY